MAGFDARALYNVFIFLLISICLTTGAETDSLSQNFQCHKDHGNATASENCSRLENSTCEFECKRGHVKSDPAINMTLTCTQEGWDDSDILCLAFQCDSFYENATASEECSLYENTSCEFSCNSGYTVSNSTTNMTLTCTQEGWIGQESLCKVFQCNTVFENATASENCSLYENTLCEFSCNSGYMVSNLTKNMSLTCTQEGWTGQESLCKVFQCDTNIENATASENCSLHENTTCEFSCNSGYMVSNLTTNMTLTCTTEGWIGQESLCTVFQCDTDFENATASVNCSLFENTMCEFSCKSGYVVSNWTTNMTLMCTQEGWIGQEDLCEANVTLETNSSSKGKDNDGFSIGIGIGVGVGVFVLIVISLVTFSLLFQRRARKRIENFSNVSIRYQISSVGIDNPAYITSDTLNGDVTIDDVIDGRRNTSARRQSSKRYSLSVLEEKDGIDLDQTDSDVLTTESWQKEKNIYAEIED